jgi:hypothetical protein
MPSPRSRFESACRVGAFAVLGWMLGGSLITSKVARIERIDGKNVAAQLPALTRSASIAPLHVNLAVAPEAWTTDWLGALAHSGRSVTWSGTPAAIAMSTEPLVDPNGGVRIDIAAPNGSVVAVHDEASPIDSVRVADLGATIATPIAVGKISGSVSGEIVSATAPDSARLKSVAVIGAAGWEGKYIASALEERGWRVVARFTVAPKVDVTENVSTPTIVLDTSKIAAVIAIDSTINSYGAEVERFVRSGGGLILAGPAGSARVVASLAPGTLLPRTRPNLRPNDTIKLGTTGFYPVSVGRGDGVTLEKRADGVAMAARRVGAGRVIQLGYDDSWRWRMAGAPGSEAAHREWWTRVVASVAYTSNVLPASTTARRTPLRAADAAPVANLVDKLGPARTLPGSLPSPPLDRRILLTLMIILLLAEWTSRRLRGKR